MIREWLVIGNKYSRPLKPMIKVRGLVLHWFGKPKQTAEEVRAYFNDRRGSYGSAHYIVDSTETIQVIPENEIAYHVGSDYYTPLARKSFMPYPGNYLLGIEMAHEDWNGRPHDRTLSNTVQLCESLCREHSLDPMKQIFTHWDITYKCTAHGPCHRWFVEDTARLQEFKKSIHI